MGNSFLDHPITHKTTKTQLNKQFRYSSCEMQGWRRYMEDAYIAKLQLDQYPEIALFGVFDGHGGGQVARFVANHFVECLSKRKTFLEGNIAQSLKQAFIFVELMLKTKEGKKQCIQYKKQITKTQVKEDQLQAGTTATVIVITKDKIICANAGDSRAAIYTGGKVIPLSFDHKPQNPIEKQRIQKTGVPIIQGRVNGLNLTRSIGDFSHKTVPGLPYNKQPVICVPDIIEVPRNKQEDKMILIGCDGVWQRYGDDHVKLTTQFYEEIKKQKPATLVLEQFFQKNIQQNIAGPYGKDNMTAIVIQFLGSQISDIIRSDL